MPDRDSSSLPRQFRRPCHRRYRKRTKFVHQHLPRGGDTRGPDDRGRPSSQLRPQPGWIERLTFERGGDGRTNPLRSTAQWLGLVNQQIQFCGAPGARQFQIDQPIGANDPKRPRDQGSCQRAIRSLDAKNVDLGRIVIGQAHALGDLLPSLMLSAAVNSQVGVSQRVFDIVKEAMHAALPVVKAVERTFPGERFWCTDLQARAARHELILPDGPAPRTARIYLAVPPTLISLPP